MQQLTEEPAQVGLESLARTLWNERHVVELLLYRLTAAKLFLAADERRFVALALDEVEGVMDLLRDAETERAQVVARLTAERGIPASDLTLAELTSTTPEPLRSVFIDHQRAFLRLATEIEEAAAANRRLAASGLDHVSQALDRLTGATDQATTYTAAGRQGVAAPAPIRLDQIL